MVNKGKLVMEQGVIVSKIVREYNRLKSKNKNKLYLFKVGKFYIFIGEDVNTINNYMVLKITKFSNEYDKCGFPVERLDDYLRVFKNLKLDVEVIDEIQDIDVIKELKNINIDELSKEDALNLLKEIKSYYE